MHRNITLHPTTGNTPLAKMKDSIGWIFSKKRKMRKKIS